MHKWILQDAKARFSEVVRETANGPQVVTRHGKDEAVVLSIEDYRKLVGQKPNLIDFMRKSPFYGEKIALERDRSGAREIEL